MDCLYCGKKINVLRKLQNEEFCSAAHRKAYNKKQEDLAVDFLRQSRPRPQRKVTAPKPPLEPSAPQPIPALAEFMNEGVTPQSTAGEPRHNAKPAAAQRHARLPGHPRVTTRGVRAVNYAQPDLQGAHAPGRVASALATPIEFVSEKPRVRGWVLRPLWMEPPGVTAGERPRVGFITYRPPEATAERTLARFSPAARFVSQPPGISLDVPPNPPTFLVAGAHSLLAIPGPPVAAPQASGNWRSASLVLNIPRAAIAPGASLLPASALPRTTTVHVQPAPSARQACIMRDLAAPQSIPTIPPFNFAMDTPDLRSAPRAALATCPVAPSASVGDRPAAIAREFQKWALKIPLLGRTAGAASLRLAPEATAAPSAMGAGAPKAAGPETLTWKFQISTGPHTRVGAIGSAFDRQISPTPIPHLRQPSSSRKGLAGVWSTLSHRSRRVALVVAIGALALAFAGRLGKSAWLQGARRDMMARMSQRAEIDIQDDFRSGLSRWTGAPGWANTWSYDPVGFARPGRLALLAGSVPLADYRLEFIAQIEKRAVAWVFRASDDRNYYAMKLVESRAGLAAVYSIVRYAVIGGRERLRIQLPLPVTGTAKTMFRVRQEIRGTEFTTYLDGQIVDTWSDASLASGGVGFFADPGETAYVRWVDVARNDDALGRLLAYLTAGKHD
jgi:hypothetical protein